jgi:dihydrofolate reductase/thymidylate synthase
MNPFTLGIVVALSKNNGFGYKDPSKGLPWPHLKKDMSKFFQITSTTPREGKINVIIMGKNTYVSIPAQHRPLKERLNFVVSSTLQQTDVDSSVQIFKTLTEAISGARANPIVDYVFVIGGIRLCEEAMTLPECSHLFITEIDKEFDADVFYPPIDNGSFVKVASSSYEEGGLAINDVVYERSAQPVGVISHADYVTHLMKYDENESAFEYNYLKCVERVLRNGERCANRTGIDTISVFDENMQFEIKQLSDGSYRLPILTTKKIFLKGAVTELLWMLRGGTSAKWLQERDVHIWDGNSTREYLDRIGLKDYAEGELGPVYGHQWVNWGSADWRNKDIKTAGINQIRKLIEMIKTDPSSRRLVLSAWNVSDLDKMALPPCHIMYIFKVTDHDKPVKTLNCKLVLRSNDMFLGSPFNILNTSVLTILMSKACNMNPGKIAVSITDAHIYVNHLEMVKEQLSRVPFKFPSLRIDKQIQSWDDMLELTIDDFKLQNYNSWPVIKAPMAV